MDKDKELLICKFYGFVSGKDPELMPEMVKDSLACMPCEALKKPLIVAEKTDHPEMSVRQLAIRFRVSKSLVHETLKNYRPFPRTGIIL